MAAPLTPQVGDKRSPRSDPGSAAQADLSGLWNPMRERNPSLSSSACFMSDSISPHGGEGGAGTSDPGSTLGDGLQRRRQSRSSMGVLNHFSVAGAGSRLDLDDVSLGRAYHGGPSPRRRRDRSSRQATAPPAATPQLNVSTDGIPRLTSGSFSVCSPASPTAARGPSAVSVGSCASPGWASLGSPGARAQVDGDPAARRKLIRFLPGERSLYSSDSASLLLPGGNGLRRVFLVLTNAKFVLCLPPAEFPQSVIELPVGYILRTQRVALESVNHAVDDAGEYVEVTCKVPWIFVLRYGRGDAESVTDLLTHLDTLRPVKLWQNLFCFDYKEEVKEFRSADDAITDDFERLFCSDPTSDSPYRLSHVNAEYGVCNTYPAVVVVPREMTDEALVRCAKFRAKNRFIAVSWFHPTSHVCIARCSQPQLGRMGNNRSPDDERFVERLHPHFDGLEGSRKTTVRIIDCRGQAAAVANIAKGGGYEKEENYKCRVEFQDIENVHVVSASAEAIRRALSPRTAVDNSVERWTHELARTGWFTHVEKVLGAAVRCAVMISQDSSALVHCTNGWDRTAQVVSLAMLMVDPHYRTIEGFCTLVDKEWIALGHKFADRCGVCGYGDGSNKDKDASPVFVLFADCVHQLMRKHPTAFQFTEDFLIYVIDAVYSNRFGTFLCNSQSERHALRVRERTVCLWEYVMREEQYSVAHEVTTRTHRTIFLNPLFSAYRGVLIPDCHPSGFRFWSEFFVRWTQWKAPGSSVTKPLTVKLREVHQSIRELHHKAATIADVLRMDPARRGSGAHSPVTTTPPPEDEEPDTLIKSIQKLRDEIHSLQSALPAAQRQLLVDSDADDAVHEIMCLVLTRVYAEIEEKEQGLDAGMNRTFAARTGGPSASMGTTWTPDAVLWVPDHMATCCRLCKVVFGMMTRRHHCRSCGEVFCHKCTTARRRIDALQIRDRVRVCDTCDRALLQATNPGRRAGSPALTQ
eukprot:TRINITY_DN6861_c0_g1_i1.p1 TRINITY_DN6861_c0_g1~~TRINITY_DN6861_c0_g1_i1.p1  ORF type:complete len:998 (+),score=263.73 TRINITY_DN6861_c0_g1_i1:65-2995(+)